MKYKLLTLRPGDMHGEWKCTYSNEFNDTGCFGTRRTQNLQSFTADVLRKGR